MDPLSLTASILTIVGAGGEATKAVRKLASLKGASDSTLALSNELSDLRLVVSAVENAFQTQQGGVPFPGTRVHEISVETSIVSSLKQVNDKVLELQALHDRLMRSSSIPSSSSTMAINKGVWLAEHKKVRRLQEDLRSARVKLAAAVGVLNLSSLQRLETRLRGLDTNLLDLQSVQRLSGSNSVQHFNDQENAIHNLQSKIDDLQVLQRQSEISYGQRLSKQEVVLHKPITQLLEAQQRMNMRLDVIEAAVAASTAQNMASSMAQSSFSRSTRTGRSVCISTSILSRVCSDNCTCVCHSRSSVRVPQYLRQFFGVLFVGYTGIPRITPPCDVKACVQRSSPMVTVAYFFPAWLLVRAVFVSVNMSTHDGPQFSLRVSRQVSNNSALFYHSFNGDIDGVKGVLSQRLGSPFDVDIDRGETALMYAIMGVHVEVCKLLLNVGADPYQEHPTNGNAYDFAWREILRNTADATSLERLGTIFPSDSVLDKFELTLLHKTVLGLSMVNLGNLLGSLSKSAINEGDAAGRTASWWAATRGDVSALSLLIGFGADVNKVSNTGGRPLDTAICCNKTDCVWLLLRSGLVIDYTYKDLRGVTSLHWCCAYGTGLDVVERLVDKGAILEDSTQWGATPLTLASQEGHDHLIGYLLSKGARINRTNATGASPLHLAIERNKSRAVRLLLRHKADYSLETNAGETILHFAAHCANTECLRVLRSFDLSALDADKRVRANSPTQSSNLKGLTALEIAESRKDVRPEWLAMFWELVHDIRFPEDRFYPDDQAEADEDFEDAVEHQAA